MPIKIMKRSAKKVSEGSNSKQRKETSAEMPPRTTEFLLTMQGKSKRAPEDTPQNPEAESKRLAHSGLEDRLSVNYQLAIPIDLYQSVK